MPALQDKVSIITGAGSGIGRATAERFGAEGAIVICLDVDEGAAKETVSTITKAGGRAEARACDVSSQQACIDAVTQTVQDHGRLDALCNIAGIGTTQFDADVTEELWSRIIGVNLSGTWFMCQAALPHLLETEGAIVNTSSTAGTDGTPWCAPYAASKAGVIGLTKELAIGHGKQGVRINCIAPGPVRTPIARGFLPPEGADMTLLPRMLPFKQIAEPSELAAIFAFLASSEASYINGECIKADGGARA